MSEYEIPSNASCEYYEEVIEESEEESDFQDVNLREVRVPSTLPEAGKARYESALGHIPKDLANLSMNTQSNTSGVVGSQGVKPQKK